MAARMTCGEREVRGRQRVILFGWGAVGLALAVLIAVWVFTPWIGQRPGPEQCRATYGRASFADS